MMIHLFQTKLMTITIMNTQLIPPKLDGAVSYLLIKFKNQMTRMLP